MEGEISAKENENVEAQIPLQSDLAVYLTAAELTRRGLIVATTTVNAPAADLLVTDENCRGSWSIQVKMNAGMRRYWSAGDRAKELSSDHHVYVFVLLYYEYGSS